MGFEKGHKLSGSRKNKPNKTTQKFREGLNDFFDGQWGNIQAAFKVVEKDDPKTYLMLIEKYMSYSFPKKRDITSDDKPITPDVRITERRDKSK
jgi:hypothetical protein